MKTKVIVTAGLLIVASGVAAAGPFDDDFFSGEDLFNDDFFNEEPQAPGDGSEDDSASDDPFNSDDWFNDDFFNEEPETPDAPEDGSGEEDENNTDDEYGVCVIGEDSPCNGDENGSDTPVNDTPEEPIDGTPEEPVNDTPEDGDNVTEEAYIEEAPEPGDPYYEAGTDDWVSYINPRDDYHPERSGRDEYPGSGKVCIALLNEEGEPISGETVPDTQISMDTSGMEWHSYANPFTVQYPVTENYERPLDSDQFGTSSDVPQGDGYMDTHCLEAHLLENTDTVEYDELEITGQHADDIEVVGYYDQLNTWDSDFDPENDVSPYGTDESSDGSVTMSPGNSHFEILAVARLDR